MLRHARKKMQGLSNPVQLLAADLDNFQLRNTYDTAISMFAVVGYLTENTQLNAFLSSVHNHLKDGGLLVFDVWHGPAVLRQLPETRERTAETGNRKIRRRAVPSLDCVKNVVKVDYTLSGADDHFECQESHRMRYFFVPELELLARTHKFGLQAVYPFLSFAEPRENDWNMTVVLKK